MTTRAASRLLRTAAVLFGAYSCRYMLPSNVHEVLRCLPSLTAHVIGTGFAFGRSMDVAN